MLLPVWASCLLGILAFFLLLAVYGWISKPRVWAVRGVFECAWDEARIIWGEMARLGLSYEDVHHLVTMAVGTFSPLFPQEFQIKASWVETRRAATWMFTHGVIRAGFNDDQFLKMVAQRIMEARGPGASLHGDSEKPRIYGGPDSPGAGSRYPGVSGIKF